MVCPATFFAGDEISVPGDGGKAYPTTLFIVDEDYLPTLNLNLVSGRKFFERDCRLIKTKAFIINETAGSENLDFQSQQKHSGRNFIWTKWGKTP
jgi:hypothetical protein